MGRDRPYDPGNFCHARCSGSANIDAVLRPWPQRSIAVAFPFTRTIKCVTLNLSGELIGMMSRFEDRYGAAVGVRALPVGAS